MYIVNGILLILVGLGAMGFGLMLFYALLPLFYAFFGVGVGYWLGSLLTSTPPGEMSFIKLIFALGGGVVFAGGAYFFHRRGRNRTVNYVDCGWRYRHGLAVHEY